MTLDRTARFERNFERNASKPANKSQSDTKSKDTELEEEEEEEVLKFSPEEEASLLAQSNAVKQTANESFAAGTYEDAVRLYNSAIETCPNYLVYERAVIKSNIAACYLKTEDWKEAVKVAGEALDLLDPKAKKAKSKAKLVGQEKQGEEEEKSESGVDEVKQEDEEAEEEIVSLGAQKAHNTNPSSVAKRKDDVERIKIKCLMRRAKARVEMDTWSSLTGAEEDYKTLSANSSLSTTDRKFVSKQIATLPPRTKAAQEKEMGEMMGKLKQLGNGILKPFGLSTENFNMVKDEKTGGYSMNFNQGG